MCRVRVGVLGIATHLLPLLRSSVPFFLRGGFNYLAPESWKKQAEQLLEGRIKSQMVTRRRRRQRGVEQVVATHAPHFIAWEPRADGARAVCGERTWRRVGLALVAGGRGLELEPVEIGEASGTPAGGSNRAREKQRLPVGVWWRGLLRCEAVASIPRPLLLTNGTRVPFSSFILRVLSSLAAAAWRRLLDFPGRRGGVLPCEHTRVAFGFAI